jgi:hypothetical protein
MKYELPETTVLVFSVGMLAFGCAEIACGALVFNFTENRKIGAWYVGIFAIVNAFTGFFAKKNITLMKAFPIVTLITAVVAFIGTLVDGIAYAAIGYTKACTHDGVTFWGDSEYFDYVNRYCDPFPAPRDCYCVTGDNFLCFSFNGNGAGTFDKDNCNPVLETYPVSIL